MCEFTGLAWGNLDCGKVFLKIMLIKTFRSVDCGHSQATEIAGNLECLFIIMKRLVFILLSLAFSSEVSGQEEKKVPYFWLTVGSGGTSVQNEHPELGAGVSANVEFKKQLVGVRYLMNKEFSIFATPHEVKELGFYWGKYFLGLNGDVYASVGVGPSLEIYYTYGAIKPNPSSNGFGTYHYLVAHEVFGIALDAQAGINFGRFASLGIRGFACLNTKKVIAGGMFDLRLGFLRVN